MKRFACSYIDWFDNELETRIVSADTWVAAFKKAFGNRYQNITNADESEPKTIEEAKQNAFNCDSMIEVIEITDQDYQPK